MLQCGEEALLEAAAPGDIHLTARIRVENTASRRLFEALGYCGPQPNGDVLTVTKALERA